jgi:hypothetical protein
MRAQEARAARDQYPLAHVSSEDPLNPTADTSARAPSDQTLEITPKALKMPPQSGEAFG